MCGPILTAFESRFSLQTRLRRNLLVKGDLYQAYILCHCFCCMCSSAQSTALVIYLVILTDIQKGLFIEGLLSDLFKSGVSKILTLKNPFCNNGMLTQSGLGTNMIDKPTRGKPMIWIHFTAFVSCLVYH